MTFIVLILFLSLFNKFAVSFLLFSKSVICEKATASPTSLSAGFGAKPKTEKDQNSVEHNQEKTPTAGQEIGILQQLLGNIGRFNANSQSK